MKIPRLQLKKLVKHILLEMKVNQQLEYVTDKDNFFYAVESLQYNDSYISKAKQVGNDVIFDVTEIHSSSKNGKSVKKKDKIPYIDSFDSGKAVKRFKLKLENYKKLLQYIGNLKKRHDFDDTERYDDENTFDWMGKYPKSQTIVHPEPPDINQQ